MPRRHRSLLCIVLWCCWSAGCQREPVSNRLAADSVRADAPRDASAAPDLGLQSDCPRPNLVDGGDAAKSTTGWQLAQIAAVPLHDVACVKGHVFVAGDKGTLLHRAPAAAACGGFAPQQVGTTSDLLTVSFADLSYGVIAGRSSTIWESRDLGKTWPEAPQCGAVKFSAFYSLHLYAADKGCGAGSAESPAGAAYKVYPGLKWICPGQVFEGQALYSAFRYGDKCWFVGDTRGRIYHTPNEGVTWYYADYSTTKPLRSVFFVDATHGVIVGDEGMILRSEDGLTWSPVSTLGTDALYDVFFWDAQHGWAVGANGTILASTDGGETWSYQTAPTSERLEAVCFTSAQEGWAVSERGSILHTVTAGN